MDHYQVDDIAHLAPSRSGHGLVHGQVDWVQNESENFIRNGGEEAVVAVSHPFEASCLVPHTDLRAVDSGKPAKPGNAIACRLQNFCVALSDFCRALFAIVKDVDVTRVAESVSIERGRSRNKASRIAM